MNRYRRTIKSIPILIILSALLLLAVLPVEHAAAATVYGRVICASGIACPQKITLNLFKDGKLVNVLRTDSNLDYQVFLKAQGQYQVEVTLGSKTYRATIRSAANPIRQDIHLR